MNDYFDKVYVLSLRRETERRKKTTERLNNIGLKFEFFDAIDGSVFSHIWKSLNNDYLTNANYVACQLSHLSIYKDAIDNNYQRILILEDDAIPRKDINITFNQIKEQIPDYDILYLGYIPLDDDRVIWDYRVLFNRFITDNIFNSKNLWGLYAYSITNSMMKEIIDVYNNNFPMELDRYYVSIQTDKRFYGTYPQMFCHDTAVSANNGYADESSVRKSIHPAFPIEDYI